jgi:DNA-binding CsgD family transcriptional regulator
LRTLGLLEGGNQGIACLQEAVELLRSGAARLELARCQVELGAALRRFNRRNDARQPLREGLDLAHRCGAQRLTRRARAELIAAGARPRRPILSGLQALTPSERRVAELASKQMSNPEVAQALFITLNTVQGHLGHVYRMLGITSRAQLPAALAE